jgi:hypothetical protein
VKSLAADGSLGDLKREVGSLIAAAGQVAEEEFGDEALWAHRGERPETMKFAMTGLGVPEHLDERTRRARGRLGALLGPAGLVSEEGQVDAYEQSIGGWRYAIAFDWSEEMRSRMNAYASLDGEYRRLSSDLDHVRAKKASSEARRLWDEA